MLTNEQAEAQLKKLRKQDWVQSRAEACSRLPAPFRNTARLFLDHHRQTEHMNYVKRVQQLRDLYVSFAKMSQVERTRFFQATFPGISRQVEQGWQLIERLPYQTGWLRKPFRAPGHPEALLARRVNWLSELVGLIGPYQQDIEWFAAWAAHISTYGGADELGILLAAAIDAGGPEGDAVFNILCTSARGEHEIGSMGRHVTRALLCASRADGWEFVEKMLLAAQREEGLRQVILETVDEAHPEAFRRMLRLILDHNLARFSAVVRAFDTWLGYQWDAVSAGVVNETIRKMLTNLEDDTARTAALKGNDPEQAYLALWTTAFCDAPGSIGPATELARHAKAEHRFVAVHLLDRLQLDPAENMLPSFLDDPDLRVATRALMAMQGHDAMVFMEENEQASSKNDFFERLERMFPRFPDKPTKLKPAVWPWTAYKAQKAMIADVLPSKLGNRPPTRLLPYLPQMSTYSRANVISLLAKQKKWDAPTRETLFALVGDASRQVRDAALQGLAKCKATAAEAASLEKLLERKSGDLRRGVITFLSQQGDEIALGSANRLLDSTSQLQTVAGLELMRELLQRKRCVAEIRARAETYRAAHPTLNDAERQQLETILAEETEAPTLQNALGLIRHEDRTWPEAPKPRGFRFLSPSGEGIILALDKLLKENAHQIVTYKTRRGEDWKGMLADLSHGFPGPDVKKPITEELAHLPLADLWKNWWENRGPELRDVDGMELARAWAWFHFFADPYPGPAVKIKHFPEASKLMFEQRQKTHEVDRWRIPELLRWLMRLYPPTGGMDLVLDAVETALAWVPEEFLLLTGKEAEALQGVDHVILGFDDKNYMRKFPQLICKTSWRSGDSPFEAWLNTAREFVERLPELCTPAEYSRYWRLLRWLDEPVRAREFGGGDNAPGQNLCLPRLRSDFRYLCRARESGQATDADVLEHLLGPRTNGQWSIRFDELDALTRRKLPEELSGFAFLTPLVEQCRRRVLEVEFKRGENPTAASAAALSLSSVSGIDTLLSALRVLGKREFVRGYARDNESIETICSHLARCSFPVEGESAADFARKVKEANIPEERLIELAVYAPQWSAFVEHALGWPSLTSAVWWIHAHAKGMDWTVDNEIRELWQADLSGRTPLTAADLLDGAVDVDWFQKVHGTLGDKRWNQVYEAARYASTGTGHARARLFADAMLGKVTKKELVQRAAKKRYQDALRALGLLPLAKGKAREADILDRYKAIQEFRRGSKQFGSQRQASEKRAAQIAQENLARTAGYPDPIRLEWAMEAKAVEDLAEGSIEVVVENVKTSLCIDPFGEVELTVTKEGKTLADIPTKLKKHPQITALRERKVELKRQASRIRPSLEQFMVRGDVFTGTELRELMQHPLLAPMLKNLVIVGDGNMGYPVHGGKALEDYAGKLEGIKPSEKLRIAHPHDLLPAAQWHRWQKDCFARERIQPFKQVFRELYPLTETEKQEGNQTRRYAGHQVQPRQAVALLGQRGWVSHPEEGVRKTFHDAGLVAWLHFQEGYFTPAEVEGLTLESVFFTKRDGHEPMKLKDLPPRLFSEAMRDLDLVVSVAHRGGVDPEASASTVEMRAALVMETTRLLKLKNVSVKDRYVTVDGQLGQYSIHLGSAVTRKMPGEMLFLIPVHSQHRGRLFLPFADNDPRTAEVLSKVLLLARDTEIKDPNILDQLRGKP